MAERELGLPIYAARQTTSTGGIFSQTLTNLPDNARDLSKGEADFLRKRQLFDSVSVEYYEGTVSPNELLNINVVESLGLPNDDIGRRGC